MASARRVGLGESISTYNSGGGADYSSLETWDLATDNDHVATMQTDWLEVEAGTHDDNVNLTSDVNNASYFRGIRALAADRHDGIPLVDGTVAAFVYTSVNSTACLLMNESHQSIEDLVFKGTTNSAEREGGIDIRAGGDECTVIGCMFIDSTNAGAGTAIGIEADGNAGEDMHIVDCLVKNMDGDGIWCDDNDINIYNCTIVDCGDTGVHDNGATAIRAKNCIANNNTTEDFAAGVTQTTCTTSAPTWVASASDDYRLKATDTVALGNGTDLSADSFYAFDDDLRLRTRNNWDIGAHRYQWYHTRNGKTDAQIESINGATIDKIKTINGA